MKSKIIVFGVFLSVFILLLVPNISCVNANIQNENTFYLNNIDIENLKTIKNRFLNSDCNCQKPIDQNNDNGLVNYLFCWALLTIILTLSFPIFLVEENQIQNELLIRLAYSLIPLIEKFIIMGENIYCFWAIF